MKQTPGPSKPNRPLYGNSLLTLPQKTAVIAATAASLGASPSPHPAPTLYSSPHLLPTHPKRNNIPILQMRKWRLVLLVVGTSFEHQCSRVQSHISTLMLLEGGVQALETLCLPYLKPCSRAHRRRQESTHSTHLFSPRSALGCCSPAADTSSWLRCYRHLISTCWPSYPERQPLLTSLF